MTGMGWVTTGDVAEFIARAGSFLRAERARNTVLLTVAETVRLSPWRHAAEAAGVAGAGAAAGTGADADRLPIFGWWTPGEAHAERHAETRDAETNDADALDRVRGAFLHTPPYPLLLSSVPAEAAAELAAKTLAARPLAGVNAHEDAATAFSQAWVKNTGGTAEPHLHTRLYRLGELTWPDPRPGGTARTAGAEDTGLLTDWFAAFSAEVHEMGFPDHAAAVRERLSYGGLTLWEADGRPVCMVGVTRQVAGMVRVGPVYTPPRFRGHGYASVATAEVTQAAIGAGAEEVLLFTDVTNPVSNSIYQRIGYQEVEDRVVLSFSVP